MIAIRAAQIYTPLTKIEPGILLIDQGKIQDILSNQDINLEGMEVIDAGEQILAPGMIDVHTHGIGGVQGIDGRVEDFQILSEQYARHGVTSFLATIGGTLPAIRTGIQAAIQSHLQGAEMLGIHMEGPFLNPQRKGAFSPASILAPDRKLFRELVFLCEGNLRLVTLAPEMQGALDLIRFARQNNIICSAGHSQATWDEMMVAIDAGISHITHTYNAMSPLNHRDPGILGAALSDDRLTVELIADGIHVHPAAIKLLLRSKPTERIIVISDSIGAAGLPDGVYHFEEMEIHIANHSARLQDGTLAGSVTTLHQELINLLHFGNLTLNQALCMTGKNQADELGFSHRKGMLAPGLDADIICLDKDSLALQWSMVRGHLVKAFTTKIE